MRYHAVQIHGESDSDNPFFHNVRFVDTGEQMLKVSYDNSTNTGSDNGVVQYCLFEYPSGVGPQFYIGGIDAHQAVNWTVRYNTFKNIRSPETALAEHAIHFWSNSQGTLVEGNKITNCDRGIGFGLGDRGHIAGVIKNNMVHTTRDVGIGLENAQNVKVYNNSLFTENYSNSIEYRFEATSAEITNNLTNAAISQRNGGTGNLTSNYTNALSAFFTAANQGDLHLVENNTSVTDAGTTIAEVVRDFDEENRPKGTGVDIGADEAF